MVQQQQTDEYTREQGKKATQHLAVLQVLRHPAMLRLWLAQVIYLSIQSTASYAMIVHMTDVTHSATLVGLVLIALTLPPFLLSAPAGSLVDRFDRRTVLLVSNILRALSAALFVLFLLLAPQFFISIYLLALFFSLVGLLFTPAEGAIIPSLVGEEKVLPAFALYNLTVNITQVIGLLVIGPLVLDFLPTFQIPLSQHHHLTLTPIALLFAAIVIAYLLAAVLIRSLPKQNQPSLHALEELRELEAKYESEQANPFAETLASNVESPALNWRQMRDDLREGWQLVRSDGLLSDAVLQACFGTLMMLTVAELATFFVSDLLHLPVNDTALIFTPAGIGLVVGSLLVPATVARFGQTPTIVLGMLGMAAGFVLLPIAQRLAWLADPSSWNTAFWFLAVVAVLTTLVGFGLDFVVVPAQARMQERSPESLRGRVLALYQALFNGGSIPVILFMGALTDLVGIVIVIYLLGAISLSVGLLTILRAWLRRRHNSPGAATSSRLRRRKREQDWPQTPINEEAASPSNGGRLSSGIQHHHQRNPMSR